MLIVVSVRAQCSADCAFVPFEWISPVIGCSLELVVLSDTRYVSRELYLFSIRDSGGLGRLEWEWNGQAGMGMKWASWNGNGMGKLEWEWNGQLEWVRTAASIQMYAPKNVPT